MSPESPRERRRRRARERKRTSSGIPDLPWKPIAIGLGILVVVAGVAFAILSTPGLEPVHDHAGFAVFVNDQRASFDYPQFDLSATGFEPAHIHIHEDGGKNIHMEGEFRGGVPTATLGKFFSSLDITFQQGKLVLNPIQNVNGTYTDNSTHDLKLLVNHAGQGWQTNDRWGGYVLRGCDQVLVSYGPTGEDLASQEGAVAQPDTSTNCK